MELSNLFGPIAVFGLACYFFSLGIRTVAERWFPRLMINWYWNELALAVLPALVGVALMFVAPKYPYPALFMTSAWSKVLFGGVVGICSGWVYRILKATVKKVWGVDLDKKSNAPPPEPGTPPVVVPPSPSVPDEAKP